MSKRNTPAMKAARRAERAYDASRINLAGRQPGGKRLRPMLQHLGKPQRYSQSVLADADARRAR